MSQDSQVDWEDENWELVLNKVDAQECVPFLGAGASAGVFPTGAVLAEKLATKYGFPYPDRSDLIKVSQYVAVKSDRKNAKLAFLEIFNHSKNVEFERNHNLHADLARLPLPLYVTTNYDDLMLKALQAPYLPREPFRTTCRWNSFIAAEGETKPPAIATPRIFHLHGCAGDPNSLVLTEDDYLDFLEEMIRKPDLMPNAIQNIIRNSTVLFIGYRLADWNFRILFRQLANYNVASVAVFPPPAENDPTKEKVQSYLDKYFGALNVKICWATGSAFTKELLKRFSTKFGERALLGTP